MTKPIIAVAMLLLYEEGRWQLDDPVTKFIPELADLQVLQDGRLVPLDRPMTMRHLMASSAGFAFGPAFGTTNPKVDEMYAKADLWSGTNDDIIPKLAKLPLEAQPGTEFRYCLQQEVQGEILRRIAGEQLDTLLERRIFAPLGMKDTGFDVAPDQRDRIPPRYALDNISSRRRNSSRCEAELPAVDRRALLHGAGLHPLRADANRGTLDGVRILSPTSVNLMTTKLLPPGVPVHFTQPFACVGYGMNVGIVIEPSHAGFNGGAIGAGTFFWGGVHGTWFWVDPTYDILSGSGCTRHITLHHLRDACRSSSLVQSSHRKDALGMSQPIANPPKSKLELDSRLDPRIKKYFAAMPTPVEKQNVSSREELLAQENSPAALAAIKRQTALFDSMDGEEIAPSAGLSERVETLTSSPDGNTIKIRNIRPDSNETLPCVYYIHGGRMIAAKGVAVAMVEFRNSVHPSAASEIAPFPAGLNDCISGLKWVHANATTLKIDAKRIIVAGESGGGNLVLAVGMKLKQDGELGLIRGIYSLCPYIAGERPQSQYPLPSRMRASC